MRGLGIDEYGYGDAPRTSWAEKEEDELPAPTPWIECKECGELVDRDVDFCIDSTGVCAACWVAELEDDPDALFRACELATANQCTVIELYEEFGPLPEKE